MSIQAVNAADLVDVYKRAIEQNNDYKLIQNNKKISETQYDQTSSTIFPEINFSAGRNDTTIERYVGPGSNTNYDTDSYNLTLRQPVFRLSFFDELEKSKFQLDKSSTYELYHKKIVGIKTVELYFELINNKNKVREYEEKFNLAKKRLNAAEKLFVNGSITRTEYISFQNELESSKISKDIVVNALDSTRADIYLFTGKRIAEIHNVNMEIELANKIYNIKEVIRTALKSFETILMANQDLSISRSDLDSNKSQHYPTLDIVASYDYVDVSEGTRFGANKREASTVGISLNFPIYQGGYQSARVSESRIKFENASIKLEQAKRELEIEIIDSIKNLEIQKGLIHIDKIKYQNANESFIAAKKGFMSGIYTDIEVQESKINLISTKNKYISTVLSYLLQDLNIKKYTNDIDVLDIQEINSILIW